MPLLLLLLLLLLRCDLGAGILWRCWQSQGSKSGRDCR
jgi:hypothetical protein